MAHPDDRACLQGKNHRLVTLRELFAGLPAEATLVETSFKYPLLVRWAPRDEDPARESRWAVATNLLVTVEPGLSEEEAERLLRQLAAPDDPASPAVEVSPLPLPNLYLVRHDVPIGKEGLPDILLARAGEFRERAEVSSANPDYLFFSFPVPEIGLKPWTPQRPELSRMLVQEARNLGYGGSCDIRVAVLDTGVNTSHPALQPNFLRDGSGHVVGWDFYRKSKRVRDGNGHGTYCAGLIGGLGYGINEKVSIIPVRFLSGAGCGAVSDAICGIQFALDHGARVISNSWGGAPESPELKRKIEDADRHHALFVAGAGNGPRDLDKTPYYPAAFEVKNVLSVGGALDSDRPAMNWGIGKKHVHLSAPGETVYSTFISPPPGGDIELSGTSASTAFVAGAAALVMSAFEAAGVPWTYLDVRERLIQAVAPMKGPEAARACCSHGRIDVLKSVTGKGLDTSLDCPGGPVGP